MTQLNFNRALTPLLLASTHAIPDVKKSTCTREQILAYHLAYDMNLNHAKPAEAANYIETAFNPNGICWQHLKNINKEITLNALINGIEGFLSHPMFYKEGEYASIGKAFPIARKVF